MRTAGSGVAVGYRPDSTAVLSPLPAALDSGGARIDRGHGGHQFVLATGQPQ
ncbi:hypothetical protein ACIG56_33090 [Nocardia fusca]|uniref:hypothetical protein n=1 Tax=Nocardia fusca TaxID=941183 RepID=UPI0037C68BF3